MKRPTTIERHRNLSEYRITASDKLPPSARPLLIQVVARLNPGRCGVSDHAIALAVEIQKQFGIDTAFVVLNSDERHPVAFPVVYCKTDELLRNCITSGEGRSVAVLVHLSGYGYSSDGAPTRLAAALEQTKASGLLRIAVYFHELFAMGRPWKSAFWLSHRQKRTVRRIARECDLPVTNTSYHERWLEQQLEPASASRLRRLPVFSTVGESHDLAPFACREPVLVVFGLAAGRQLAYRQLYALEEMMGTLGVRQILDIGPPFDIPSEVNGIAIEHAGELPISEVHRLLSSSMFGFVVHPPYCLAKSSIFAGYCAHGVIPVVADSFGGEVDGLSDGIHVVSPATVGTAKTSGWESCSAAAWNWYMAHCLRAHAEHYAEWMSEPA